MTPLTQKRLDEKLKEERKSVFLLFETLSELEFNKIDAI